MTKAHCFKWIRKLHHNGRTALALAYATAAINKDKNNYEGYEKRSEILFSKRRLFKAQLDNTRVSKFKPLSASPHFRRGFRKIECTNYNDAAFALSKALKLDNGYFRDTAYFYRAWCYLKLGIISKAKSDLDMVPDNYSEPYFFSNETMTKQKMILMCKNET
ncbi:MAG: tetratricopeptide repeat protein [Gammaproteobacteria bacterium]|nr:tetratricopeptide repeat protein [Gammaproteobacteria bacterium]MDH5653701.1 tetratricopeptide repeat protein [Gammaproteobacteria bacterium]